MRLVFVFILSYACESNGFSAFEDHQIVYPEILGNLKRIRRDVTLGFYYEENIEERIINIGDYTLLLDPSESNNLKFHPNFSINFLNENSEITRKNPDGSHCEYRKGIVQNHEENSVVALTICGKELTGYIKIDDESYFLEPFNSSSTHILYKSSTLKMRPKRSVKWEYFNLTGDTIDINFENDETNFLDDWINEEVENSRENVTFIDLDSKFRVKNDDEEELGYFVDTAWQTRIISKNTANINTTSPPMWLELALAVDHTVIDFHGKDRVQQYVLSLMNIVNAIYQDPTLDANIQLIITRLVLFENASKSSSTIILGDAVRSLQNVNAWNRKLHMFLKPGEPKHDVAIWLTRVDIGGPSGYAPVAGACDPKRSCTLNRDEGLTSAFIIAHELAHILGLSHDGAQKDLNTCGGDSYYGSIMAPMVSSTFHKFIWSDCSKKEFHEKSKKFHCLFNKPISNGKEIVLNNSLQFTFTMDEQCRVEFGEGYSLCRSFDIVEVCSHLWCAKDESPLFCRTKRAPPLEGTDCGFDKWCINGYCEAIDRKRFGRNPLHHNPQNGRWSSWSPWGSCSKSCGIGVEFRSRKCDNPPPMYGGTNCFGLPEEWRLCNVEPCTEPIQDLRTLQCNSLAKYMNFGNNSKSNMTWLPFESDEHVLKCKLTCISKESRELYMTDENLIDGTFCSYESTTEICIQGNCHHVGCDGKLFSNTRPDSCGVCGGNNTECKNVKNSSQRKLKKELQRMLVIPRLARGIKIEANVSMNDLIDPTVAFMLKDRAKQSYSVSIPNTGYQGEIMAGTKFHYKKYLNRHVITATGPLLSELVIYIFTPKSLINRGVKLSLSADYFVHKDYLNKPSRYVWIIGGWGPCSKSCGNGQRQKTTACFDTQTSKIIARKECSLLTKPYLPTEKCNTYSCNFHWVSGSWEPCSKTCGSHGTQTRELYCLPQSVMNTTKVIENSLDFPWKFMVSPSKCGTNPPAHLRHCNRVPCQSYWEYGNWSQCSVSCGTGISIREAFCPQPDNELFYNCGSSPPQDRKICHNPLCKSKKRKFVCKTDQSIYCDLNELKKYCKVGFFRRYCCKSCGKNKLSKITS